MDRMPEAEFWDVTDEHGASTGDVFRRGADDFPVGRFHRVAAVCVVRPDGCLLLTQRSVTKDFPLAWEFAGGSALAGETSAQAAARELREETGLVVAPEALVWVGRHVETSALVDLYVAPAPEDAALRLDSVEVHAARWVRPEDVVVRLETGQMAAPWTGRLLSLWPGVVRAADSIVQLSNPHPGREG